MNVLLIEDDDDVRMMVAVMLRSEGISCVQCETAEQGLTELDTRSDIDVVVTDFMLEGSGMNGAQVAREVMGKYPDLPVVVVTAAPYALVKDLPPPEVTVLTKPFTAEDLQRAARG